MAKFKFVGDPNNEELIPDVISAFGVDFENGKASEVTDERAIGKLRGNSHFEEVKGKAEKEAKAPAKKAKAKATAKKDK